MEEEEEIPTSPPIVDNVVQSTYFASSSTVSPAKQSQVSSSQFAPSSMEISTIRYDNDNYPAETSQIQIPGVSQDVPVARQLFEPATMEYGSQETYTQILAVNPVKEEEDISTMAYVTPTSVPKIKMCSLFCKRCKVDVAAVRKDIVEK